MINETDILEFFNQKNYDIRISGNARWIDQKCTPDVVSIVADCIIEYISDEKTLKWFSSTDIWKYNYTEENIQEIFNKPNVKHKLSQNEYDKFFSQPLEMLAASNLLLKNKKGRRNFYLVNNFKILEYISLHERNSLKFIYNYCEKTLKDSGIWEWFESFLITQDILSYQNLKNKFENYIIQNTPINGVTEVRRIFTKIINPIAFSYKKRGSIKGRISKNPITYSELMYNRENFRDLNKDKPKGITRQEWKQQNKVKINVMYYKYQSKKAKKVLRKYNDHYRNGISEINDEFSAGKATQIHHIFPEHQYPEISMFLENLIALTPTQHLNKAHPLNNTHLIDPIYQEVLLKSKVNSIENNILSANEDIIYDFSNLIEVINIGFDKDYDLYENDFTTTMTIISNYYAKYI